MTRSKKKINLIVTAAMLLTQSTAFAETELTLRAEDYSIPAWNSLLRNVAKLPLANTPYSINMTVNGDPATRMAFTWFTNKCDEAGVVQIVAKADATEVDFLNSTMVIPASMTQVTGLNYSIEKNYLDGVTPNQKVDYTSHKALATGLNPSTTYSFRVGNESAWSEIGHFTTASADRNEPYTFIYITDTQAQNDAMFNVSQKTVHAAIKQVPEASFVLCNGDLVETSGSNNSEWEYEQWFSTMQDVWLSYPLVVTMGNHDKSPNGNFGYHFFNSTDFNDKAAVKTAMDGTVFSFVRGDVLYMIVSYEDYATEGYLESLSEWMRTTVKENEDINWRVVSFHKNMFTGSKSHQDDADGKAVRAKMLPLFDELGINIAFQGHDHIYEVIGPVKNADKTLVENGVESVEIIDEGGARENMTGKAGGVFDVSGGTLYFLNNSAGKKKYEPRNEEEMIASFDKHEIENYWGLFSGKFGQTGEPTFSKVEVSKDAFVITTYTVDDNGDPSVFDSFKVVKDNTSSINEVDGDNETKNIFYLSDGIISAVDMQIERIEMYALDGKLIDASYNSTLRIGDIPSGVYIIKGYAANKVYAQKMVIA